MLSTETLIEVLSIIIGTLGVTLLFGVEKKVILWALLSSLLCCLTYEITLYLGGGLLVASMLGAGAVAAYSDMMAHWLKVPATVMIIPGIIILVPGGKLYYTMLGAVSSDSAAFYQNGRDALLIAAGLAIGIIAVTAVSRPLNAKINEYKLLKAQNEANNNSNTI